MFFLRCDDTLDTQFNNHDDLDHMIIRWCWDRLLNRKNIIVSILYFYYILLADAYNLVCRICTNNNTYSLYDKTYEKERLYYYKIIGFYSFIHSFGFIVHMKWQHADDDVAERDFFFFFFHGWRMIEIMSLYFKILYDGFII